MPDFGVEGETGRFWGLRPAGEEASGNRAEFRTESDWREAVADARASTLDGRGEEADHDFVGQSAHGERTQFLGGIERKG